MPDMKDILIVVRHPIRRCGAQDNAFTYASQFRINIEMDWRMPLMRISPVGALVVALGAIVAIVIWTVGYFGLPNEVTHRNLAANPKIQTSVSPSGGLTGQGGAGQGQGQAQAAWYALDKAPKTLDLSIASENGDDPMNFNGYSKGALKITVPVGWTVHVTYTNQQTVNHSVGFVPWSQRESPNGQFTEAFKGSTGPSDKFQSGVPQNQPYQFSFVADKAGQYALVCGVPGHAAGGMWDEFDVDANAKAPTITTDQGSVTVTNTAQ
jgi:sulfocyanin